MANKIQIRRGLKTNLPSLDVGEPALCTDTREVYVGNAGGNVQLVSKETLDSHTGNYTLQIPYAVAAGLVNSYTVTLSPAMKGYTEGVAVAVKINATNTAASTINICGLGAKSIVDSKGNALTAGKLVANSIYTLRYNGTNFILQGEGGEYGTAGAGQVLSGYTIGTDSGIVNGSIATKAAETYSPATSVQTITAGQYLSGVQTISPVTGTAAAADVASGKTFCSAAGVYLTGTNTNKKWASGTVTPTTGGTYIMDGGSNAGCYNATVSGLTFTPSFIVLYDAEDIDMTIYSGLGQMGDGGSKIIAGIGSQVSSYYSGTVIKLANLAVVSNTGFTLPTWKNKAYTWIAYE